MIKKFNLSLVKAKNKYKIRYYKPVEKISDIRKVLTHEAIDYVRRIKKIPANVNCMTYTTDTGKIAVLALDTPKKRLLHSKAQFPYIIGNRNEMDDLRRKYGFIPRPINVLRKYVDYGFMRSQDVEHLYHNRPVDFKISDNKEDFENAYRVDFNEKDCLVEDFNGYSCMSEEPKVGTFYYYFGAYMLIFYKKDTDEIIGRMVLWKWEDKLYAYKAYVRTDYQFSAASIVEDLQKQGTIVRDSIPSEFYTELQRIDGKTPQEIYDEVRCDCHVPYIDEDLELDSDNKTKLSFYGGVECKSTNAETLADYGINHCDECGCELSEDDVVWVDDSVYCTDCACHCSHCEEWYHPDHEGEVVDGLWVCQDCIESHYRWCEHCEEYVPEDEINDVLDERGHRIDICDECMHENCKKCECGQWFWPRDEDQTECPSCEKDTGNDEEENV